MTRIGVAMIARPTFDVEYARDLAAEAWRRLGELGHELVGSPELILDADALDAATTALAAEELDSLVIVQATFADATLATAIADANAAPVLLWAFPEQRVGGRLRLNSFCGINLAGYRLTRDGRRYRYLYEDPRDPSAAAAVAATLAAPMHPIPPISAPPDQILLDLTEAALVDDVRRRLAESTVGIVGEHPDGFEPCGYDADLLASTIGVTADPVPLPTLFERADGAPTGSVREVRVRVGEHLVGADELDPDGLERSLRLHLGLRALVDERGWAGVATRCWPECFTQFGAACCSPHSMLNDDGTPGCCEADAYGAVTSLILQWLGGGPAFVADLVDLDASDGTGVLWHCGMAPLSMASPAMPARATVHTNRCKPLLNEFPLRSGRVTIARLSQSRNVTRLAIGGGEMLDAQLPYTGTGGVLRFDRAVRDVIETIMLEGLEHHYGMVYGDVRRHLRLLAHRLRIPVIEL